MVLGNISPGVRKMLNSQNLVYQQGGDRLRWYAVFSFYRVQQLPNYAGAPTIIKSLASSPHVSARSASRMASSNCSSFT